MKVYKSVGSKERFLEMFQNVNKTRLNEGFVQGNDSVTILEKVFKELLEGTLKVYNTNNELEGDVTHTILNCNDTEGNDIQLRFESQSQEGVQDGVFGIKEVKLEEFVFNAKNGGSTLRMDAAALQQFNQQHKSELADVISDYVDVEDNEPQEDDSLYESAITRIDKIPTKKLPAEVNEDEEKKDYPDPIGKKFKPKTNYPKKKKKTTTTVNINEGVEDRYENVVFLQGDEAFEPLQRLEDQGQDAALAYLRQWHYPNEHELSAELGHGSGDQTYEKDGYIMSWNSRLGYIGLQYDTQAAKMDEVIGFDDEEEPKTHALGAHIPKSELSDDELQQLGRDKEEAGDMLQGGVGDGANLADFDLEQVKKGLSVESEHSDNPVIALEIVLDHLTEDPEYYGTGVEDPEQMAKCDAQNDANKHPLAGVLDNDGTEEDLSKLNTGEKGINRANDDEMTDVLLGYKPLNVGDTMDEIVGGTGATPAVNDTPDQGIEDSKKLMDYQKRDVKTLSNDEKKEYLELWKKYIGMNYEEE